MLPDLFSPQYLRQLEVLRLRARRKFLGTRQGAHRSLKRGHGIEFFDYRKYELGDNPRHIDWSLYARSERLYIKRFQEEQDISLLIFLDGSASMFTPDSGTKWKYAVDLALSLAYIAFFQQDRVALAVPDNKITPFMSGPHALHKLAKEIAEVTPLKAASYLQFVRRAVVSVKQPGMAVFISDFLMPLSDIQDLTQVVLAKNLDTTFIQVLSDDDRSPSTGQQDTLIVDSETSQEFDISLTPDILSRYQMLFDEHQKALAEFFKSRRLNFIAANTSLAVESFVSNNLSSIGIVQ